MGSMELLEKVRQFKDLQIFMRELEDEMDAVKAELVNEMNARQVSEMVVDVFTVRYTAYTTSRIDSASLKKDMPELAERYTKMTDARRFTIS